MKKTLKLLLIVAIMVVMAVVLTGCGKEESKGETSNKEKTSETQKETSKKGDDQVVATMKMTEEDDGMDGTAKYILYFENDLIKSVDCYLEFDDEETAQAYYSIIELGNTYAETESDKMEAELEGKTIKLVMDEDDFNDEFYNEDEPETPMTKAEIISQLESEGFTVEK